MGSLAQLVFTHGNSSAILGGVVLLSDHMLEITAPTNHMNLVASGVNECF